MKIYKHTHQKLELALSADGTVKIRTGNCKTFRPALASLSTVLSHFNTSMPHFRRV